VRIEDYVHDYNSVERFKATYQFDIYPMVDKEQWHEVDLGFVMVPPKLERHVGRPRVCRIKGSGEAGKRGPYQCKRCFQFSHIEKTCREPPDELGDELPPPPKARYIFNLFCLLFCFLFPFWLHDYISTSHLRVLRTYLYYRLTLAMEFVAPKFMLATQTPMK
jgi:hypothetical protein